MSEEAYRYVSRGYQPLHFNWRTHSQGDEDTEAMDPFSYVLSVALGKREQMLDLDGCNMGPNDVAFLAKVLASDTGECVNSLS